MVVLLAVLSGLCTLGFVLAPVTEHTASYSWSSSTDGTAAALPLVPYQAMALDVSVPCAAVTAAGDGTLLSTYPLDTPSPAGLRLDKQGSGISVVSNGVPLASDVALPASCDRLTLSFTPEAQVVAADGAVLTRVDTDQRPQVVGFFTPLDGQDGLSAETVADTRFDTSPTALKYLLGAAAVVLLVAALVVVGRGERQRRRLPWAPVGAWRPRISDGVVAVTLAGWAVIGPSTVDDGYIMGILRGRGEAGFVGNYSHWFNAPEAPFGWFYEPYAWWASISAAPVWMRIPAVVAGILSWLVLSRLLAPRLFRTRTTVLVAVALPTAFLVWWLPFNSGVRPEPLIALGTAVALVCVDRARVTRTVLPLCLGGLVAGFTLGFGPTGVIAFLPFLAMLAPLLRWWRTLPAMQLLATTAALLASAGLALLVMCGDQSLAALLSANHARTEIGPSLGWQEELVRYQALANQSYIEGSLFRRLPLLASLAGAALLVVVTLRDRTVAGLNRRVGHLLTLTFLLCFAAIAFTPTKWTHHFGAFAVLGAAVLVAAVHAAAASAHTSPARRGAVYAGAGVVFGLTLYGNNTWWYLSSLGVPFGGRPPALGGVGLSTPVMVLGVLAALGVVVWGSWRGPRGPRRDALAARRAGGLVVAALVLAVLAQVGTFAAALQHRGDAYSVPRAGLASLTGSTCSLEDALLVEPNKADGVLGTATSSPTTGGFAPVAPEAELPAWQSAPTGTSRLSTTWVALPERARTGTVPLVVAAQGAVGPSTTLTVQLRSGSGAEPVDVPLAPIVTALTDLRVDVRAVAPEATEVRLLASHAAGPDVPALLVAPPRVPVTQTLAQLTAGRTVATDWTTAFYFPCTAQPQAVAGRAEIADFRLAGSSGYVGGGEVNYAPQAGGTFAGVAAVTRLVEIPTYLSGDPTTDAAHLYRMQPRHDSTLTAAVEQDVTRQSWSSQPPLLVPGA